MAMPPVPHNADAWR